MSFVVGWSKRETDLVGGPTVLLFWCATDICTILLGVSSSKLLSSFLLVVVGSRLFHSLVDSAAALLAVLAESGGLGGRL